MATDVPFVELMQRVRAGDQNAALELHAAYAEQLQRIVRVRLTQPALRRQFDSLDICQSVFADFFVRTALGQYDLRSPEEFMKLLATMARNRLFHHSSKQRAARRDFRRIEGGPIEDFALPGADATPSRIVSSKELLKCAEDRLTEEERRLVQRRRNGETWEEIAASTGRSAEAMRKQYERALNRVSAELGMGQLDD
ncbi:MAG TPA: sigma-70 family RNA polymerase sigma factor [Planctomycetaceae bacterium]|jgi:RNA polymerase sigma factor (sigma-70 family)|nr:sigma-70 family RNA polymerase sigma factor [Planctomycetaceae bacterium]